MKTPFTTVTNYSGRTFAVRYLPSGARYGRANCIVNERNKFGNGSPIVEFYDTTNADDSDGDYTPGDKPLSGFGPLGQFVTRYDVATILGEDEWGSGHGALNLDGGVPVWYVDAEAMHEARAWLRATRKALEVDACTTT